MRHFCNIVENGNVLSAVFYRTGSHKTKIKDKKIKSFYLKSYLSCAAGFKYVIAVVESYPVKTQDQNFESR